jgi:acetyltransferase-like isoleucine patch superfamily enzyme
MMYYLAKIYYLFKYVYHRIFTPFYHLGWPVVFCRGVEVNTSQCISIGSGCVIGKNALIQVDRFHHFKYGSQNPKLKIGTGVFIGKGCTISAVRDIEIEDNVGLAPYCYIADNSHGFERVDIPIRLQELTDIKPVKIKSGSWLGWGVAVMPGVTIGKNSVIGAHSVVNKDVPDYCVAVGAPAKVVKKYDSASKEWRKV